MIILVVLTLVRLRVKEDASDQVIILNLTLVRLRVKEDASDRVIILGVLTLVRLRAKEDKSDRSDHPRCPYSSTSACQRRR